MIVWDGWQGNPPDAFAALSGALTAGGLLFWLMPPLDEWRRFADPDYPRTGLDHGGEHPFAARMADILADHEAVIRISPGRAETPSLTIPQIPEQSFRIETTPDQEQLIQRLVRFGQGRRKAGRKLLLLRRQNRMWTPCSATPARLWPINWSRPALVR